MKFNIDPFRPDVEEMKINIEKKRKEGSAKAVEG